MQQYKFRGKRKDNSEWVVGFYLSTPANLLVGSKHLIADFAGIESSEPIFDWNEVLPETVGMWTGWNDKNGNEIFEGDKLRGMIGEQESENRSPITSTVIFKPGGFEVFTKSMSRCILGRFTWCDAGYHGRRDVYRIIEDLEIIGNIHEKVIPLTDSPALNTMNNFDPGTQQAEEVKAAGQVQATEQEAQEKAMESEETEG